MAYIDNLEYKSIEEKLGIDLATLFKVLEDGVYYDEGGKTIKHYKVEGAQYQYWQFQHDPSSPSSDPDYDPANIFWHNIVLSDYGKTSSLPKNELE